MQRISETISKQNKENELLGDSTLQRLKNKLRFDFSYESTLQVTDGILFLPLPFQYKQILFKIDAVFNVCISNALTVICF